MAHAVAFATIWKAKTREHLRKVLRQRNCEYKQQHNSYPSNAFNDCRTEICLGCWWDRPFLDRTHLVFYEVVRWEGRKQHDRTPTKNASALESFPATVTMPSAWSEWSKFQFLRSWFDPDEIRTAPNYDLPVTRPVCTSDIDAISLCILSVALSWTNICKIVWFKLRFLKK